MFPSQDFNYVVDLKQALGQRIQSMSVRNENVELTRTYHVTMNSFLASGGDGFFQFSRAETVSGGDLDIEALVQYIQSNPGLKSPTTNRIRLL
jgi:5'-nucleotidase